jgi:hypothetical protein
MSTKVELNERKIPYLSKTNLDIYVWGYTKEMAK